ncbi:MAG TPA: PilZ domain-containing protein [Bryobacteraceae bacterium]
MARKDVRRHQRISCRQPVLLAWTAEDGSDRYARGKCRDVSAAGLRIETFDPIPAHSLVSLRIETWDLAGSARVRYSRRSATGVVIGLELNQNVRQQILDRLRNATSGS